MSSEILNKRNCPLCGSPVMLTEFAVGYLPPHEQNVDVSVTFVCTGCGSEFSASGKNIHDLKNDAVCHFEEQERTVEMLGEIPIGKW